MATTQLPIGKIIGPEYQRDAIHIAVAPVQAGEELQPGYHVRLVGGKAFGSSINTVGIVDPFLNVTVKDGEYFFLFLYPHTITNLRHEWEHPLFQSVKKVEQEDEFAKYRTNDVLSLCNSILQMRRSQDNFDYESHRNFHHILADALEELGMGSDDVQIIRNRFPEAKRLKIIAMLVGGKMQESVRWIEKFATRIEHTFITLLYAAEMYTHGEMTYDNSEFYKVANADEWNEFWDHYKVLTGQEPDSGKHCPYICSC